MAAEGKAGGGRGLDSGRDRERPQLVALGLLSGMVGVSPERGEVVAMHLRLEAERGRQLPEPLERGALVARHARDGDECGRVANERLGVDQGVATGSGAASGAAASACARCTALVSART